MEALRWVAKAEFEPLTVYAGARGFFARIFLINSKLNENRWRATWAAIKKDGRDFVGKPTILTPDFDHTYSQTYEHGLKIQEFYRIGTIVDVIYDDGSETAYAIVKFPEETWNKIDAKEIEYVSPAIWPRSKKDSEIIDLGDGRHEHVVSAFHALHLAFVDEPAYGKLQAYVDEVCDGEEGQCIQQLSRQHSGSIDNEEHAPITLAPILIKNADTGRYRYETVPDCVHKNLQKKVQLGAEITEELVADAYSHCDCKCNISTKLALMKAQVDIMKINSDIL